MINQEHLKLTQSVNTHDDLVLLAVSKEGSSMKKVSRILFEWAAICNILREKQEEDHDAELFDAIAIASKNSASEPNNRWVIITSKGKRGFRHSLRGFQVNIQYGNTQIPCRLRGTPVLHLETKLNILTNDSIPVHSCIAGSDLDPELTLPTRDGH